MRKNIAVALCLAAVAAALWSLKAGHSAYYAMSIVATVWLLTRTWLGNWLWVLKLNRHQRTQGITAGALRVEPLAALMVWGGVFMSLLSSVVFFVK